uniref:Secreted protein n=1 Tax=Steinernema glaseri TaxID=37863 RepID=A0A1I7Z019_9BILA
MSALTFALKAVRRRLFAAAACLAIIQYRNRSVESSSRVYKRVPVGHSHTNRPLPSVCPGNVGPGFRNADFEAACFDKHSSPLKPCSESVPLGREFDSFPRARHSIAFDGNGRATPTESPFTHRPHWRTEWTTSMERAFESFAALDYA